MAALPLMFTDLLPLVEAVFANILDPEEFRSNAYWSPDEEVLLLAIGGFCRNDQRDAMMVLRRTQWAIQTRYAQLMGQNEDTKLKDAEGDGEAKPPKEATAPKESERPTISDTVVFQDLTLLADATELTKTRQTLHWTLGDPAPLGLGTRARQGSQPFQLVVVSPGTPAGEPQSVLAVAAAQVDLAAYLHRHAQAAVVLMETDASWERNFRKGVRRLLNVSRLRPTMIRTPAQVLPGGVVFLAGTRRPGRDLIASLPSSTLVIAAVGADQAARCLAECSPARPVERIPVAHLNAFRDATPITWSDVAYLPGTGEVTASSLYGALRFAVTFARHHGTWPDWRDCPELVRWETGGTIPSGSPDAPYAKVARRVWQDRPAVALTTRAPLRLRVARGPEQPTHAPLSLVTGGSVMNRNTKQSATGTTGGSHPDRFED